MGSSHQKSSWKDFLCHTLSERNIEAAASKSLQLRKALPKDYLNYLGSFNRSCCEEEKGGESAEEFKKILKDLIVDNLVSDEMIDKAADCMGREYIHESLPK